MLVTKEQKQNVVTWLKNVVCSKHISDKSNGEIIRAFHMSSPLVFLYMLAYGPVWLSWIILLFVLVCIISFFIFDGCIVSSLEKRLRKDDFNILDPMLEYYGMELTNAKRMEIMYSIMVVYPMIVGLILYNRFYL